MPPLPFLLLLLPSHGTESSVYLDSFFSFSLSLQNVNLVLKIFHWYYDTIAAAITIHSSAGEEQGPILSDAKSADS